MEVHQHTHTARKKWNHYFWEFFMMFAAVSASFFVENQREHYIERQKEKQYMRSMLADLKSDTSHLGDRKRKNKIMITELDALFKILRGYRGDVASLKIIYALFADGAGYVRRARLADRTISQLKSSGNMRLIHVQAISDSLLVYEERKKLLDGQGEGYKRENDIVTDLSRRMLDYNFLLELDTASIKTGKIFDAELLFEFSNEIKLLKDQIDTYVGTLIELQTHADNIITLIKKHYRLK